MYSNEKRRMVKIHHAAYDSIYGWYTPVRGGYSYATLRQLHEQDYSEVALLKVCMVDALRR